ncbi:MAG TPA: DUF2071 domain-containing protein [Polyangiaceae bacterium]|nr:DUF2071 domain-containing protein [Polyangiaceae bacterium]
MSWHDLLFLHYRADADRLASTIPRGLELDTFDGAAFVSVVPFRMTNVGPRGLNFLPRVSAFPELNVRTYVTAGGRPGVWFYSLDAASALAVEAARAFFHLPYLRASMKCDRDDAGWVHYESERVDARGRAARFRARYRALGSPRRAAPRSLEEFLTDRYCLYAADRAGRVHRGHIHHVPWPLRDAQLEVDVDTMTEAAGLFVGREAPVLHFVDRLDVIAWTLEKA